MESASLSAKRTSNGRVADETKTNSATGKSGCDTLDRVCAISRCWRCGGTANLQRLFFSGARGIRDNLGGERGAAVREKWYRRRTGSDSQQRAHTASDPGG